MMSNVDFNKAKSLKRKTSIFWGTFYAEQKNRNKEHVKWIKIQFTHRELIKYANRNQENIYFPHVMELCASEHITSTNEIIIRQQQMKPSEKDDVYSNKHV